METLRCHRILVYSSLMTPQVSLAFSTMQVLHGSCYLFALKRKNLPMEKETKKGGGHFQRRAHLASDSHMSGVLAHRMLLTGAGHSVLLGEAVLMWL